MPSAGYAAHGGVALVDLMSGSFAMGCDGYLRSTIPPAAASAVTNAEPSRRTLHRFLPDLILI
jgi:hypothetical protein